MPKSISQSRKKSTNEVLRRLSSGQYKFRYTEIREGDWDDAQNTLQVAFSSEYPVERVAGKWEVEQGAVTRVGEKYLEVLSHDTGHADLSQLNNDGAVLDEHDSKSHLGRVKRAEVSADKVGRAVLEFDGETDLSQTRYRQMKKRSRPHVSFGYNRTKFIGRTDGLDGALPVLRFEWKADEISSVASPADPTVGTRRSGKRADIAHCLGCGEPYDEDELDDDYRCDDCGPVARSKSDDFTFEYSAESAGQRGKKKESVTYGDLISKVSKAVKVHDDFKKSYAYAHDILLEGEDEFSAIVYSDGKYFQVPFEIGAGEVHLDDGSGEGIKEVHPGVMYQEVGAEERAKVDSSKLTNANPNLRKNIMAEPAASTVDEKKIRADIRAELEPQIRTAVVEEITKTRAARKPLRDEIRALAAEMVKKHGTNWNGPRGQVVVVGEQIRKFEAEAIEAAENDSKSIGDSEIRQDFKTKCGDIIRGSRKPLEQTDAANLPDVIASRCSLGRILREGARKMDIRSKETFMIEDGAEAEADKELRNKAQDFPGGQNAIHPGINLPMNMPSGVRGTTPIPRMNRSAYATRDALAGDFGTAGALIAPEFEFPTIELLRNLPALGRAGITILSGVMGNLVLPRQTAATIGQAIAEGGALLQYDQTLDQIKLDPHRVGTSQNYSRLALLQPTPDFEAMVMADHMAVIALKIDQLLLNGQGGGAEPLGVMNQIIPSVAFGGSAANAFSNAILMETQVRKTNIYEPGSFITTSTARGTLMGTARALKGTTTVVSRAIWENETIADRPAFDTQQIPFDSLLYGVWRHMVMAQWGGLAVVLDTITRANQDEYRLSINTYIDGALRHNSAICRSADSLATLS